MELLPASLMKNRPGGWGQLWLLSPSSPDVWWIHLLVLGIHWWWPLALLEGRNNIAGCPDPTLPLGCTSSGGWAPSSVQFAVGIGGGCCRYIGGGLWHCWKSRNNIAGCPDPTLPLGCTSSGGWAPSSVQFAVGNGGGCCCRWENRSPSVMPMMLGS